MFTPVVVFAAGFTIIAIALATIAFSDRRVAIRHPFGRPARARSRE